MAKDRVLPPEEWAEWPDEKLLDLRLCQLGVSIDTSVLAERIGDLQRELDARGLAAFRPYFWLSDEWFSPDGVPGVAIPFYLAHPRLERLERTYMLEVEGGTPEWCMRILRHEAGHAIDNAYTLRRRRRRQQVFGPSYKAYPQFYDPRPYSKSFVLHLDSWYAQSHPDEDFAETFAVWLSLADWRERYAEWPALKKLEYMDALMRELAGKPMLVATHRRVDPLPAIRKTLRAHYERKRRHYGLAHPDFYDRDLRRLFSDDPRHHRSQAASTFIRHNRARIRELVSKWTGEYQLTLDAILDDMIVSCRELNLRAVGSERKLMMEFTVLLTAKTVHALFGPLRRKWIAL